MTDNTLYKVWLTPLPGWLTLPPVSFIVSLNIDLFPVNAIYISKVD